MITPLVALSLFVGLGKHIGIYQDKYYDNPVGIVRIVHPVTKELTIQFTHNSSTENGLKTDNKDTNVLSFELKLF